MPFCPRCGNEVEADNLYCRRCGAKLVQSTQEASEIIGGSKKAYNKWIRSISVILGTLLLIGSLSSGLQYYFESGLPMVLISEVLTILIGASLVILGLFPDYVDDKLSSRIDIEGRYPEIIVGLIILTFIFSGIEPEPPGGWWDYKPGSSKPYWQV